MDQPFVSSPASTHADAPTPTPNGGWYRVQQLGQTPQPQPQPAQPTPITQDSPHLALQPPHGQGHGRGQAQALGHHPTAPTSNGPAQAPQRPVPLRRVTSEQIQPPTPASASASTPAQAHPHPHSQAQVQGQGQEGGIAYPQGGQAPTPTSSHSPSTDLPVNRIHILSQQHQHPHQQQHTQHHHQHHAQPHAQQPVPVPQGTQQLQPHAQTHARPQQPQQQQQQQQLPPPPPQSQPQHQHQHRHPGQTSQDQTHPPPSLLRTTSTYSAASIPALSNGASPDTSTDTEGYTYQYPYSHPQSSSGYNGVGTAAAAGGSGQAQRMAGNQAISQMTGLAGPGPKDTFEPGIAVAALAEFVDALSGMEGATLEEWDQLVEDHFDDDGRFLLTLAGEDVRFFDISTTSLPRFFITLSDSGVGTHSFNLREIEEKVAPLNDAEQEDDESGSTITIESSEFEWRSDDVVRKGTLMAGWNGKIERLEIVVHANGDGVGERQAYGLPEEALRVLDVAQQMEHLAMVMEITEEQGVAPHDALRQLVQV